MNPCPAVIPRLGGIWSAFELAKSLAQDRIQRTVYSGGFAVGTETIVLGIDIAKARDCFDAVGEPWDKASLELFEPLASGWRDELARTRK